MLLFEGIFYFLMGLFMEIYFWIVFDYFSILVNKLFEFLKGIVLCILGKLKV